MRASIPFPTILLILLSIFCLTANPLSAQETVSFQEAMDQGLILFKARGLGGFSGQCLEVALKNVSSTALNIEVPAGHVFASKEGDIQDLIITKPQVLALEPGASTRTSFNAMCTQSYNMSPDKGEEFLAGKMAEGDLLDLATTIAAKGYQNSTAQSAIWSVANGDPVSYVFGEDTEMVRELATMVSEATGEPMSSFDFAPRPHVITPIKTSMEVLLKTPLSDARLYLVSEEGEVVRTYFEGRQVERGFVQYRVGGSHALGEEAKVFLRLYDGDLLIREKAVTPEDTVLELQAINSGVTLTYDVPEALTATAGIYDDAGDLYMLLKEDMALPAGHRYSRYIAQTQLPFEKKYSIRVVSGDQVLAEEYLDPDAPAPTMFPKRTVAGVFAFSLEEEMTDLQLNVYDEEGRIKRKMMDIHHMNPGDKKLRYSFEHRDGPDARFYLRLVDGEGNVIAEKGVR